ncbi:MAG: helix-turn-helix domain-containing protein [Oscillospiraceae bacterium]|nr:helix-turn-helix domain-containing protein [Oscillospiraceae bacterium]
MAFAQQLQEVRRAAGLTQEEFAAALQVSRQSVSKWESGRGYPEIEKILYICNRFGVTPNQLFAQEVPAASGGPQAAVPDTPPPPAALPDKSLHGSLSAFLANLSPKNKAAIAAGVVAAAVLSLLIGLFLKGGTNDMTLYIWIGLIVVFGIAEAATAGLVSIWFVLGSVAGLVAAVCGGNIWVQVIAFFVVSIAALIATRPLVKQWSQRAVRPTNLDQVIGQTARVTEAIDNTVPRGAVYVQGKTWTARSESGDPIPADTLVTVARMEGVRLFVRPQHISE